MNRQFLRSFVRRLGFDGMSRDRFDRLAAAQIAAETQEQIRPLFYNWARRDEESYLVQIGANDGTKHDHIRELRDLTNVRSLLIEPNPACLASLHAAVAGNARVCVLPHALAATNSSTEIHRFNGEMEAGLQLNLFTSFSRAHVEHFRRYYRLQTPIVSQQVATRTLASLLREADFPRVDLLFCDIEGYDHLAVDQALALPEPPRLLVFEHFWLSPDQRERCYRALTASGYGLFHGANDTFCARTA